MKDQKMDGKDIKVGSRVRVNDGENYAMGKVVSLIGFTDKGGSLWSIEFDNAEDLITCPADSIELWPTDPLEQSLAKHGFTRADIPYLLSRVGIDNSDTSYLIQGEKNNVWLSYFVETGIIQTMKSLDYKNVTVVYGSRSLADPGMGTLQQQHHSTVKEALDWCRTHYGNPNFRSPWIQTDVDGTPIWTPAELEALLATEAK